MASDTAEQQEWEKSLKLVRRRRGLVANPRSIQQVVAKCMTTKQLLSCQAWQEKKGPRQCKCKIFSCDTTTKPELARWWMMYNLQRVYAWQLKCDQKKGAKNTAAAIQPVKSTPKLRTYFQRFFFGQAHLARHAPYLSNFVSLCRLTDCKAT